METFRSIHRAADVLGQSIALSIGRLVERLGLGSRIVRLSFRREDLLPGGPRLESEVQAPVTCKSARSTVAVHVRPFATEDEARQKWALLKPSLNRPLTTGGGSSAKPPRASSADGRPPRPPSRPSSRPSSREQAGRPATRSRSASPQMFGSSELASTLIIGGDVSAPRALRPLAQPPNDSSTSRDGSGSSAPRGKMPAGASSSASAFVRTARSVGPKVPTIYQLHPPPRTSNGEEEEEVGTVSEPARPASLSITDGRPLGAVMKRKGSLPSALREELGRPFQFWKPRGRPRKKGTRQFHLNQTNGYSHVEWDARRQSYLFKETLPLAKRKYERRLAMSKREDEVVISCSVPRHIRVCLDVFRCV